jgi:hypothetical protein
MVVITTMSNRCRESRNRERPGTVRAGMSIDLARPFRGSAAVSAGLLTWGQLRGPRFRRLFPDVYAPARLAPDLALRSAGAAVLVDGRGVLAGYSAAELLGASCGPADAPAEVLLL